MNKQPRLYCATDKDVFDVLESSRQKMTTNNLLKLGRMRGIFYSPSTDRETLVKEYSQLPHDHYSLQEILDQCEHSKRSEKIFSKKIEYKIDQEKIVTTLKKLNENSTQEEVYSYRVIDADRMIVSIKYSEFDYSRTRLAQIQQKEANIEIITSKDVTTIRLPANEKASEFYITIKEQIEKLLAVKLVERTIEIPKNSSPELRTVFFTELISGLDGYNLDDVTSLKISSPTPPAVEEEDQAEEVDPEENQEEELAKQQMLSIVKNISFQGTSLQRSPEYNQFKDKGYSIASIIWRSKQQGEDNILIECDASFEDNENGTGFKYNIRGHYKPSPVGGYLKTLRQLDDKAKQKVMHAIEASAEKALATTYPKTETPKEA